MKAAPKPRKRTASKATQKSAQKPAPKSAQKSAAQASPKAEAAAVERRMHQQDESAEEAEASRSTALATPLDLLLADAGSPLRRFVPGVSGLKFTAGLARHPRKVARRTAGLAAELTRVGLGRSRIAPGEKDRRFTEEAWAKNPLFKRTLQSYLAVGEAARGLVDDAAMGWGDDQRIRFIMDNLVEAAAPSNNPFLNPKVLKRTLDTGGGNLVAGGRRFVKDFATAPRVPSMVEADAFEVGRDIAVTPGAVVLRTDVFELIQYTPQTPKVRSVPLLIVPPTINKYYVIDLAEQRSMVEYLVQSGQQVFCISWRNPDVRHADWGLDTYGQAILEAMSACEDITRQDSTAIFGICSGGMIASMVMAHLAATGELDRVAAYSLAVTVLDQERAGVTSALLSHKAAAASTQASKEKGYLDGRTLAEIFAWLRPNDLIWNYWVNNYLMGHAPKAFDILYWNADPVRMTAAMHRDFMDLAIRNALVEKDAATILGSRVDLSRITTDSYVVAGIADHLCKWESCYQTTQLFGGDTKFVLSTSGHIAAMVNPPGNPKASFQTSPSGHGQQGTDNPEDTQQWLSQAVKVKGSWWDDYVAWLGERCGEEKTKPRKLGNAAHEPLAEAPGTYVHDR
ncbi:PHA/PHB synthase family protein [Nocardioides scoriae]|uniref:PHA/PHB synthase family protein n=1 Tax=Nocardioides scoriae TaxID=642780 RepID=UPI0018D3CCC2|nr:alpha/beta fold hydrolase [Nocardioides scoriae]